MSKKIGRNDPCPCGSGKKYKNCCLKKKTGTESGLRYDLGTLTQYLYKNDKEFREMSEKHHQDYINKQIYKQNVDIEKIKRDYEKEKELHLIKEEKVEEKYEFIINKIRTTSIEKLQDESDSGDSEANLLLGLCYLWGYIEHDFSKAYLLTNKASESGNRIAKSIKKEFVIRGIGTEQNLDIFSEDEERDEINDMLAAAIFKRRHYEQCIRFNRFCMESDFFKYGEIDPKNEQEESIVRRFQEYKDYLIEILERYPEYIDENFYEIRASHISEEVLKDTGIDDNTIEMWEKTYQLQEQKQLFADELSIYTVTCQFLNEVLEEIIDELYDMLLSFETERESKREIIDKYWFLYDVVRIEIIHFLNHCQEKYNVLNYSTYKGVLYVEKETCLTKPIPAIFDSLYTLSYPLDFRACRMMFDLYRLEGRFDYAEWAFVYLHNFIFNNFNISGANDNLMKSFANPDDIMEERISINQVITYIIDALNQGIDLYDEISNNEKIDLGFEFIENPTHEDAISLGVSNQQSKESSGNSGGKYLFALSNTLPAVDFMIEAVKFVIDNELVNGEKSKSIGVTTIDDSLKETYSRLKKNHYRLIERVYRNDYEYEKDIESIGLSIKDMEIREAEIARQMQICDAIDTITDFESLEQIETYFENKKQQLNLLKEMHPKTKERLENVMARVSNSVRNLLTEKNYTTKYLEEIDSLIDSIGTIKDKQSLKVFRTALASGEFLYASYIKDEQSGKEVFDYSFIAIQYYTAFESLLNNCVYCPYKRHIEDNLNKDRYSFDELCSFFTSFTIKEVSKQNKKGYKLQETIELGKIANILSDKKKTAEMKSYLNCRLNSSDAELITFGKRIKKLSKARNKAAHGSEVVSFKEAQEAKQVTFDGLDINEYRGLILDFLKMLKE